MRPLKADHVAFVVSAASGRETRGPNPTPVSGEVCLQFGRPRRLSFIAAHGREARKPGENAWRPRLPRLDYDDIVTPL